LRQFDNEGVQHVFLDTQTVGVDHEQTLYFEPLLVLVKQQNMSEMSRQLDGEPFRTRRVSDHKNGKIEDLERFPMSTPLQGWLSILEAYRVYRNSRFYRVAQKYRFFSTFSGGVSTILFQTHGVFLQGWLSSSAISMT